MPGVRRLAKPIGKSDLYDKGIFMSLDIHQIAEAFSSHRFVVTYPYMADEIKWNIVGREELMVGGNIE